MATLHSFKAVRPAADFVTEVSSVPYDVISADEARELAAGKDRSFLHVIRPEIDLPPGTDEHDDAVYATGAANLRAFVEADFTVQEPAGLYVYRLVMDGRSQTGIFGCVSVDDYDNDVILKHEKTRPDKEDDRTRHIVEQRAHAEPVMLTFRDDTRVSDIITQTVEGTPIFSFKAQDGVDHAIWSVADPQELSRAFDTIPNLYVADGHHRCKAASRAAEALAGADVSDEVRYFPAVLFPMSDLKILAYNRLIKSMEETPAAFLKTLRGRFKVEDDAAAVDFGLSRRSMVWRFVAPVWRIGGRRATRCRATRRAHPRTTPGNI